MVSPVASRPIIVKLKKVSIQSITQRTLKSLSALSETTNEGLYKTSLIKPIWEIVNTGEYKENFIKAGFTNALHMDMDL